MRRAALRAIVASGVLLGSVLSGSSLASAAPDETQQQTRDGHERTIVVARNAQDYGALREQVRRAGGTVVVDIPDGDMLVITGPPSLKNQVAADRRVKAVARDHVLSLNPPDRERPEPRAALRAHKGPDVSSRPARINPDPAVNQPGLLWNILRVNAPRAWQVTPGSPDVLVGVIDTGIDATHSELAPRIAAVQNFATNDQAPVCQELLGDNSVAVLTDADLAAQLGVPESNDFNGHGSSVAGVIAADLNGAAINGVAPRVKLVSLKVAQWCGQAFDSTLMHALTFAAQQHIPLVNMSFGDYLDLRDPDQRVLWEQWQRVVARGLNAGTLTVAPAGNEHVQIDSAGRVTSHGSLSVPGTGVADLFGKVQAPGGIPGVIDVSATTNIVAPSVATCPAEAEASPDAVCKPTSDRHQAGGQGRRNQLAFYSNFGPRIDLAAPGGARKFNLPLWDRGGTLGFPFTTDDGTTTFGIFSTASNTGVVVPCLTVTLPSFSPADCYANQQGGSLAAPHATGVAALILSHASTDRLDPRSVARLLKDSARKLTGNRTQITSTTDTSPGDLNGLCPDAFCHLGGRAISDRDAYGAGLVDAAAAVRGRADNDDRSGESAQDSGR